MKLNEMEARLPAWYYSSIEPGGPSYHVESPPGRGKTSVFREFKARMKRIDPSRKYGFAYINGASFTLMTGMGYLMKNNLPDGRIVSEFTLPPWYFDEETGDPIDKFDGGVILMDEVDKLQMDEKKIVGEAALAKRLANHPFPPGWVMWFAGNRLSDRSGSTRDLDHLINRRITINVKDDVEAWVDWARKHKILPEVIHFAEDNVQLLFEPKPEDQRPWCTPRSIHQANIHIQALMDILGSERIPVEDLMLEEEIAGSIGKSATAQLFTSIRLGQELASYDEVVHDPAQAKLPVQPSAKRLMAYKLADKLAAADKDRTKDALKVLTYVQRMELEFQVIFVRLASSRKFSLVFEKPFAEFCAKNAQLVAILNRFKQESD
jgi:hypothetical protein